MNKLTESQQMTVDALEFFTAWFYVALMFIVIISIIAYCQGIRWSWILPQWDNPNVNILKVLGSVGK